MSESGKKRGREINDFGYPDHADVPVALNNPNPVVLNISGDLKNLVITSPKRTEITVGGDMDNTSFFGQNLHSSDITFINVAGRLWNRNDYTFDTLSDPLALPAARFPGDMPDYFAILRDAVL